MGRELNKFGLTQAQENFCKFYVKYGIGRKAYMEAYPKSVNWKGSAVDCEASKMLDNPKISQRIDDLNEAKTSVLLKSEKLSHRKLLETAIQMLEDTNNPAERQHAVSLLKLLFQKEGMTSPDTAVNVNIQNNQTINEVVGYLDL